MAHNIQDTEDDFDVQHDCHHKRQHVIPYCHQQDAQVLAAMRLLQILLALHSHTNLT